MTVGGATQASAFSGTDTIYYYGIPIPAGKIGRTHERITRDAAATIAADLAAGSASSPAAQAALTSIIAANAAVDDDQTHAAPHFDGESFPEGQARILALRAELIAELRAGDVAGARAALGSALHTVQDFYSHSNWVELGNSAPNPDLGRPGRTLSRLGPQVRTCSGTGSSTLVTNGLTSGYYPGEDRVFVTGKCHHGGILDSTVAGINKDSSLYLLSPHADRHEEAASLATTATVQFVEQLGDSLTRAQLLDLLGLNGSVTG